MKRLVSLLLTLMLCCTAFAALSEDITLKVWDGQDDQELLKELESQGLAVPVAAPPSAPSDQISMLDLTGDEIRRRLETITVETLTPIEALNTLYELKQLL